MDDQATKTPAAPAASPDGGGAPELAAAVDLGSNSFHMLVARVDGDRLVVIDRLKERVRLAAGIGPDGKLTADAQERALACLQRFGQRLADMPVGTVRAVGTNTLRKAKNRLAFLVRARQALGHPIEVVSGREEARLVYLGVAHSVADPVPGARRLVVDIGGGSTECIIGENMVPLAAESLYMGCVSFSQQHFPDGAITAEGFERAFIAARLEMEPHKKRFRSLGWERAVGSSGTIKAVEAVLEAHGWGPHVTLEGLERLRALLVAAERVEDVDLPGLSRERAPVFPGGVAILEGVMRSLRVGVLEASEGTIREGALLDVLGRRRRRDARDATVRDLQARWGVDSLQAARVERTARGMLASLAEPWKLDDPAWGKALAWAARLHELGLVVAHSGYHKHGAYILANADLPGFSKQDQQLLAALVRVHRRKLGVAEVEALPRGVRARARRTAVLLRIAVRLHRSRSDRPLPPVTVETRGRRHLRLAFPPGWLEAHPLTAADLERERRYQQAVGLTLDVGTA